MSAEPSAIAIVGPTAVGKTELALRLAASLNAEIVSVDSRQVYRHMDIGTAKPTPDQRAAVEHHLLDLLDPSQRYSAGRFAADARDRIARIRGAGRVALLVGGSGLYLSALVDGLFDEPGLGTERGTLVRRLAVAGLPSLYADLGRLDPVAAQALSPNDEPRILRALELAARDGCSRGERWQAAAQPGLGALPLMVCLTRARDALCRRIDERAAAMLNGGWPAEVERLLGMGFCATAPGLVSLGYRQIVALLQGRLSQPEALEQVRRCTRQYAKRQLTWFRRDRRLRWLDLDALGVCGAHDRVLRQWEAWAPSPGEREEAAR